MSELERKVDARQVLRAYQRIVETGERDGDVHRLGELLAGADVDGYTVWVADDAVTARVLFHSRVAIETGQARALERFVKRLEALVGPA